MAILNIGKKSKGAEPLLDHRLEAKLCASQKRRAEVSNLLNTLISEDGGRCRAAVDEAQRQLDEVELQVLAGRSSDAELARYQAALIAAKKDLAVVTVRIRDLQAEADRLDNETIPAQLYQAKCQARDALQAEALAVMKAMLAAAEQIPQYAARYAQLRQLASQQFPHTYKSQDPDHDYRFQAYASIPIVAQTSRVIRHTSGGGAYYDSQVRDASDLAMPLIEELREEIAKLEKAIAKGKV